MGLCRLPNKEWRKLLGTRGIASEEYGDSKLVLLLPADLVHRHSSVWRVERVDVCLVAIESVLRFVACIEFLLFCSFACNVFRVSRRCLPMLPVFLEPVAGCEGQLYFSNVVSFGNLRPVEPLQPAPVCQALLRRDVKLLLKSLAFPSEKQAIYNTTIGQHVFNPEHQRSLDLRRNNNTLSPCRQGSWVCLHGRLYVTPLLQFAG